MDAPSPADEPGAGQGRAAFAPMIVGDNWALRDGLTRPLIAAMLPGPAFFAIRRPGVGLVCLALQLSIVGWLPAALWAARAMRRQQANRERQRALAARLRPS